MRIWARMILCAIYPHYTSWLFLLMQVILPSAATFLLVVGVSPSEFRRCCWWSFVPLCPLLNFVDLILRFSSSPPTADTTVRRYGLNTGLGCNVRWKEICSTSRNLHPLELGQNGANSRLQHFWFGRTWFHREKVVHIGPPPSGVPPKNIT